MTEIFLDYPKMMERALRGVVREALTVAAAEGLPGSHHFYVSFRPDAPGVSIADHLAAQHPDTMTIVLENKFWDLQVDDKGFEVTLSFGGNSERLEIPFAAVTSFMDPSVKFGLQFEAAADVPMVEASPEAEPKAPEETEGETGDETGDGRVVALDNFRKK